MISKNRFIKNIYNKKIFNPIRKYIDYLMKKIEKSIRFELMVVIAICFVTSFIFYGFVNRSMKREKSVANITYNYDVIKEESKLYVYRLQENKDLTLNNEEFFYDFLSNIEETKGAKAYIVDLDGNILKKTSNVIEDRIDIFSAISSITNEEVDENSGKERKYIYPLNIGETRCYFLYQDTPDANIKYTVYESEHSYFSLLLTCIMFIILFIMITNKKMKYLDEIAIGLRNIASGNLQYHIEERGNDEISNLASNINYMANEINKKIISERNAEKSKADLITNVSHDLRTPLTSIMGYIGLVKDEKYDSEETKKEYLNIAFNKSEKLKILIEDLFEYTKLNNDGIKIVKQKVNLTEFLFQLTEEMIPLFEQNNLSVIKKSFKDKIYVELDPDKMVRVFENLLSNAIKYSYKPGAVNVMVYESEGDAIVRIKNRGANISSEKVSKLFDRFYRVDESRNAATGGSGLGLAISKNIVELHGGSIWAECIGEDISFYVRLKHEK